MVLEIKEVGEYRYIDEGDGEVLVLLHGLFGALSNWERVVEHFSKNYRVVIPMMPIYSMPLKQAQLDGLLTFIEGFIDYKGFKDFALIGNSLGGHVGLMYTLAHPEKVKCLTLTGSSGLYENSMGGSYPKRGDHKYIKERVQFTFYDPATATDELVEEVFETVQSTPKCLRMISFARSAQKYNMSKEIGAIKAPTLLVWGLNDTITPPLVGHEFHQLMPNTELKFIDECGHAPMMEQPELFNSYLEAFLKKQGL